MALSGSTDFSLNAQRIAREALELCGVVAPSEVPAGADIDQAYRAMNLVAKQLQANPRAHPWKLQTDSVAVVDAKSTYTIAPGSPDIDGPRPAGLRSVGYVDAGGKYTPMLSMTRGEYDRVREFTDGVPNRFHFHRTLAEGRLVLPQFPATGAIGSLRVTWKRPFDDFDSALNDPDFPQEWINAFVWLTAAELLSRYSVPAEQKQRIEGRAQVTLQALLQEE